MTEQGTLLPAVPDQEAAPARVKGGTERGQFGLCWGRAGREARQFHSGTVSAQPHTVDAQLKAQVRPLPRPPAASLGDGGPRWGVCRRGSW